MRVRQSESSILSRGPGIILAFMLCAPALSAIPQKRMSTINSKEARIKTDAGKKVARIVGKRIDNFCEHFRAFYDEHRLEDKNSATIVCRIFDSYDDFAAYYKRTSAGGATPAAYFSPSLNALVLYNDDADVYLRQTLFHECSHQYLNRYIHGAPKWCNEGLSEYFEGWLLEADGTLVEKRANLYDLMVLQQALAANKFLTPRALVEMPAKEFNDFRVEHPEFHGYLHYVTSWGLVYYFLEGPEPGDRELFSRYLRELNKKGDRAKLDLDWQEFEARWKKWMLSLDVKAETVDDHLLLGAGHRQVGDWTKALAEYGKAFELEPVKAGVRYWIGLCHKRRGAYDQAVPHLEAALAENSEDARAPYMLGRIFLGIDQKNARSDPAKALGFAIEASTRSNDRAPTYLAFLARCQSATGDHRKAIKTAKRILKIADKEERELYLALIEELEEARRASKKR